MPIPFSVASQFRGFAVYPEDVEVSDVETQEITINRGGTLIKVPIGRKALKVTVRGILTTDASALQQEALNNRKRLILSSPIGEDITIGQYVLKNMILVDATPSPLPVYLQNTGLIEGIVLTYHSMVFDY